jgi:hypothetical protein
MLLCSLHVESTKACFVPCTTITAEIARPCFHIYVVVFYPVFWPFICLIGLRHISAIFHIFCLLF